MDYMDRIIMNSLRDSKIIKIGAFVDVSNLMMLEYGSIDVKKYVKGSLSDSISRELVNHLAIEEDRRSYGLTDNTQFRTEGYLFRNWKELRQFAILIVQQCKDGNL